MGKGATKKWVKALAFIIAAALIITSLSFALWVPAVADAATEEREVGAATYGANAEDVTIEPLLEFLGYVRKYYKDDMTYKTLLDGAMKGIADCLDDPYSVYYEKPEEKEAFENYVQNVFGGIGVTIQAGDGKYCKITDLFDGCPADKAGLQVGDLLYRAAGKSLEGLTVSEVSNLLRGEVGTRVTVVVLRGGKEMSFDLVRAVIPEQSITYLVTEDNIGYMKISKFDSDVEKEFAKAMKQVQQWGAKSLIIDERDNPGGYMNGAVSIASQILPEGKIIGNLERKGKVFHTDKAEEGSVDLPIILLVNENSASASEYLAAALKENKAATLVGKTTYGKGVAQNTRTFSDGSSAKLSTEYFKTPTGKDINKVGVTPDVVVDIGVPATAQEQAAYQAMAPMSENTKPGLGATGLNVYGAQQRLAFLGYYDGKATGTMDQATLEAVKKFQKEAGLYAYGVLDNSTRTRLESAARTRAYYKEVTSDKQLEKALELARAAAK